MCCAAHPGAPHHKTTVRVCLFAGYGAVVLAVVTIFIGVTRPARKEVQTAFLALYIVALVCLVSVAAGMYMDGRAHTLVKAKNTDI